MTLTAMRPDLGLSKGREVSLLSVAQASSLISALRVILSDLAIVGAQEIGVADEEALLVVAGVDEPAGDALRTVAAYFAGVGVKDVYAIDLHLNLAALYREYVDVWLAENDEQVALAGVLQIIGHVQVGIHARLEYRDAPEFVEFRGVGVVVEGTGNKHVEVGIAGLAGSGYQIGAGDGAEFRADEDGSAFLATGLGIALDIRPSARTRSPGQGVNDVKVILSSLCACCSPAVLRCSRIIWTKLCSSL